MTDYSEIIYVMGAMIIFSMLSLNASHFFRVNEQFQYQSQIQYNAVAVAKDVMDDIRWISDKRRVTQTSSQCICNDFPKTVTRQFGTDNSYAMDYRVNISISDTNISGTNTLNKIVTVDVSNEYLPDNQSVKVSYLKSFVD